MKSFHYQLICCNEILKRFFCFIGISKPHRILNGGQRPSYMRLGVVSDQLWIYQLERMGEGNTKPSICFGCHGWRI
jgi:hypothetical protein